MDKKFTQYTLDNIGFRIRELMVFYQDKIAAYQDFDEISKTSLSYYVVDKAIYYRLNALMTDYNYIIDKIKIIK